MHRTIPRTLLLAVLIALAAPAAGQAAIRTVDYEVVIDGTLDYNRADADTESSAQHDEAIGFRTTIPRLTFHGAAAEDSTGALGSATVSHGSYVITGASGQVRCLSHEVAGVTAGGLDATFAADRTIFAARVIDSVTVAVGGCDLAGMGTWQLPLTSGGAEVGVGVFDANCETVTGAGAPQPGTGAARTCVVPKVRGLKVRKAKRRVAKAGCKPVLRGRGRKVVRQSVKPGKRVPAGTVVRLKRGR